MSVFQIELTEKQWEIVEEERLAWFREHQYPHPISFEREIGGTGYTVNAHFSKGAETVDGKVNRILNQNITL